MIFWHSETEDRQEANVFSHVGGQPLLPPEIALPLTPQSGEQMTFFYSIALDFDASLRGRSLSVFASTTYFDENDCIPQMFGANTSGYDVPAGALDTYQRQFRLFVTTQSDSVLRADYKPRVRYNVLKTTDHLPHRAVQFAEREDHPRWILDDEAPGTYAGIDKFKFLLQTMEGYRFRLVPGAPRQMLKSYDPASPDTLVPSRVDLYDLWARNAAYFFATEDAKLLVVPQSD